MLEQLRHTILTLGEPSWLELAAVGVVWLAALAVLVIEIIRGVIAWRDEPSASALAAAVRSGTSPTRDGLHLVRGRAKGQ